MAFQKEKKYPLELLGLAAVLSYYALLIHLIPLLKNIYSYYPYYGQWPLRDTWGEKLLLASLVIAVWCTLAILATRRCQVSSGILGFYAVAVIVPYLGLWATLEMPFNHLAYLLGSFFSVALALSILPRVKLRPPSENMRLGLELGLLLVVVYSYLGLIYGGALGRFNWNLYDVYFYRTGNYGFPAGVYALTWTSFIILPYFALRSFYRREYLIVASILLLQVMLFPLTSHKSYAAVGIAIIVLYLATYLGPLRHVYIFGALALALMMLLLANSLDQPILYSLLDRIFLVPAAHHTLYFDYFSNGKFAYLSGTRFDLGISHYSEHVIPLVSGHYWGRSFHANVGWVGDAFAQFGTPGIVFYTLALITLLWLLETVAGEDHKGRLSQVIVFGSALSLSSAALPTVLLTSGMLLLILVLWLGRTLGTPWTTQGIQIVASDRRAPVLDS